jgi:cytochrome bd ubiquinol oxidase subunit II
MSQPILDLVPIWTFVLGFGVFLYVLLDGFDLGVGVLYGFAPDRDSRNLVMNSIAPIWDGDGNETWLVLGGIALMAAFPLAFAIIIPAVYFPILIMLLTLIFRGVAFEFRYRDAEHRTFWDHAFNYGSVIGAFAQGIVLGAFIHGFDTDGRHFAGGSLDCFTPFSLLTGVALVFGYSLLGAGWLILKTEGALQDWARSLGRRSFVGVLIGIAAVSLWTPFIKPEIADRWFSWPHIAILAPVPLVTALIAFWEWRSLNNRSEVAPFIGAICLFVMSYLGIAISLWPMIVPLQVHSLGGRVLRGDAGIPARRHAVPFADHLHVYRLVLLGVSRQGPRRPRLSLTRYSAGVTEPSPIGAATRAGARRLRGPSDRRCQSA